MAKRNLHGSRGILTGASSGIGRALATQLVHEGAHLVAVARRGDRLETLARELADEPGAFAPVVGDVTNPMTRQAALESARHHFGGLDFLINNAGSGAMGNFAEAEPARLRSVMEVNFFAAAEMIRLALPHLQVGVQPIVVNLGSILGHRGIPFCAEYCASKFALQGLSESLRAEWTKLGIDLLVVSPGTTETEFFDQALDAKAAPWGKSRGLAPERVAKKTIAAMRQGRHEIILGGGRLLVWMNRLSPALMDRFLSRYG